MPDRPGQPPEIEELCLEWQAEDGAPFSPWQSLPTIARRIAYAVRNPAFHSHEGRVEDQGKQGLLIRGSFAAAGVPVRNFRVVLDVDLDGLPFAVSIRGTDAFGELLIHVDPAEGLAEAFSVCIDRLLKGGVSYASPWPEEQIITPLGRLRIAPILPGRHELVAEAVEERVQLLCDGRLLLETRDPDILAGQLGLAAAGELRVYGLRQVEYITAAEKASRDRFVQEMTVFAGRLDDEYDTCVAAANTLAVDGESVVWKYPETGASLTLQAVPGGVLAEGRSGLYGDARMFSGVFSSPAVRTRDDILVPDPSSRPVFEGSSTDFSITLQLAGESGRSGAFRFQARLTENATWFCAGEFSGVDADEVTLAFGLDPGFRPLFSAMEDAGRPAELLYGPEQALAAARERDKRSAADSGALWRRSLLITDGKAGHFWTSLTGHDTEVSLQPVDGAPAIVLRSRRSRFRWAMMWLPYHPLNLTGYRKRMLHFIRYAEGPVRQYLDGPPPGVYPSDEELERYAAGGVRAMVWHHPWTGNRFRERQGFVVNEQEMRRASWKAHELGIEFITYIGIVPGRHPALRYKDLACRMTYDKNWDLQDFTLYSVAGRFPAFLLFMTERWLREYGLDGFYTDGGLALVEWGRTGLSEEQTGLTPEELNDRFYSAVRRVLRRGGARFGLENWGAGGIHLAGPFYDCRMIGEAFQETSPESYRDRYNPLLTGTPFKMYGMDLTARNRYNIAMAAVCMTDIQVCSGNHAWGCWPDAPSDWANLRPFWNILDSIDWDHLLEAFPWWAQELVEGEGFYAGYYATPRRVVLFLANREECPRTVRAFLRQERLPEAVRGGVVRQIYPECGEPCSLGDGVLTSWLPALHDGPVGFEILPRHP